MAGVKKTTENETAKAKRVSQSDVPGCSLEQALRIPRAIVENYANKPVSALQLASALGMQPTSGSFRLLCGAAIAYGLTEGGYNAQEISLTDISKKIFKPLEEGDDLTARRQAILKPRVIGEFLNKYNESQLPRHDIACNVLEEMQVPQDKTEAVYALILESAKTVGFLREIKNKQYIDLSGVKVMSSNANDPDNGSTQERIAEDQSLGEKKTEEKIDTSRSNATLSNRKVFITHGKNKDFIEPIKKLLGFGEMIPIVSVEKQTVSKPVPDKVMEDMRSCGAAIIHVEDEMKLIDQEAQSHAIINPNVLIEIGAAMALFGRRFILLVKQGVTLPSNLQGLYEVRYNGETLDGEVTIKLLEAIKDMKSQSLPKRDAEGN